MTNNAKQRILRQNTQAMFPYLIEITHIKDDGTSDIYRYANCDNDITYKGNVYHAGYFEIEPPEKRQDNISDARLTLSAIDLEWIKKIRNTNKHRSKIKFIAVILYENNEVTEIEPIEEEEFMLTNASWSMTTIEWTMKFDELMSLNIPCEEITDRVCPALA